MRFSTLSQWLAWQEKLHFTEIDPGLDRIDQVWRQLGGTSKLPFPVITVAGTNGKGSSVAMTAAILQAAGYRVATYTSPHLLAYNERISINGTPCSDAEICDAFERIDQARESVSLTYFEFATLAAADLFIQHQVDVAVFEVGMGGRLDAVNLFDADIALITPIGLDHTAWLGDNREKIGREKAGIMRATHPVVCAESSPPQTVIDYATQLSAPVFRAGKDYQYQANQQGWSWRSNQITLDALPLPALAGAYQLQNAAAVIQVCQLLHQHGLNISAAAISAGLAQVKLAGRFQVIDGAVTQILDVTHNQQGAENLATLLQQQGCTGKTYAVLAMLKDKDCEAVATALKEVIDHWYLAGLAGSRGMTATELAEKIRPIIGDNLTQLTQVNEAYSTAMSLSKAGDRVLVFGSFHTVEAVMREITASSSSPA